MSNDWYRRKTWTKTDEEEFFIKLKRSRGQHNKAQYLRIQAGYLEDKYPVESLRLLDMLVNDFPEQSQLSQTFLQKAHCFISISKNDEAINFFRKVLEQEKIFPNALTQGYLDFPLFIVANELKELFNEAKEILLKNTKRLMFPVDRYRYHTALAIIEWEFRNIVEAKEHAILANEASKEKKSGFRYHPEVGLVEKKSKKIQKLLKEIENS